MDHGAHAVCRNCEPKRLCSVIQLDLLYNSVSRFIETVKHRLRVGGGGVASVSPLSLYCKEVLTVTQRLEIFTE